jgi:hypothetical protein
VSAIVEYWGPIKCLMAKSKTGDLFEPLLFCTRVRSFGFFLSPVTLYPPTLLGMLETVLFASIRFHDTVNRGRVLNRFGKDFEGEISDVWDCSHKLTYSYTGIDSSLSDNFGRTVQYGISTATTLITLSVIGGPWFILGAIVIGSIYWSGTWFSPVQVWVRLLTDLYSRQGNFKCPWVY